MPEGDTVFRTARSLHKALAGRVLLRTDFRVPQHATADLSGQAVTGVVARGKHLLLRTDGGWTLHTHLRMDGEWRLLKTGDPLPNGPVRTVLETDRYTAVAWRMPVVELLPTEREHEAVGHLGPDLLGPDWDVREAVRRLQGNPEREIADALLDQRNLAGIGNLYKSEVLFLRGVSPFTRVAGVPDLEGMLKRAKRLLEFSVQHGVQSTTGARKESEKNWVFERPGQPCRRCGALIQVARQEERLTYWCPRCQAAPGPPAPAGPG